MQSLHVQVNDVVMKKMQCAEYININVCTAIYMVLSNATILLHLICFPLACRFDEKKSMQPLHVIMEGEPQWTHEYTEHREITYIKSLHCQLFRAHFPIESDEYFIF